jgi:hypothetical protein
MLYPETHWSCLLQGGGVSLPMALLSCFPDSFPSMSFSRKHVRQEAQDPDQSIGFLTSDPDPRPEILDHGPPIMLTSGPRPGAERCCQKVQTGDLWS